MELVRDPQVLALNISSLMTGQSWGLFNPWDSPVTPVRTPLDRGPGWQLAQPCDLEKEQQ